MSGFLKSPQIRNVGGLQPHIIFCGGACGLRPHAPPQKIDCPRRGHEKPKRRLLRSPGAYVERNAVLRSPLETVWPTERCGVGDVGTRFIASLGGVSGPLAPS